MRRLAMRVVNHVRLCGRRRARKMLARGLRKVEFVRCADVELLAREGPVGLCAVGTACADSNPRVSEPERMEDAVHEYRLSPIGRLRASLCRRDASRLISCSEGVDCRSGAILL